MVELHRLLESAGFEHIRVKTKEESKEFIEKWSENQEATQLVLAADIEAKKPGDSQRVVLVNQQI